MFSVTFADHREKIKEKLERKLLECVRAASKEIAHSYQLGLQETIAPPHSNIGEIPHAFAGFQAGFGPVNEGLIPNNRVEKGFARDQGINDYLANYIEGDAFGGFEDIEGFVGFRPSHVASRAKNYLLRHNESGRPWVIPLFRRNKANITRAAKLAFEGTE